MAKEKSTKKGISGLFIQNGSMDITFLFFVVLLLIIGLVMLFSASYAYAETNYGNSYKFIVQQTVYASIGFVLMLYSFSFLLPIITIYLGKRLNI